MKAFLYLGVAYTLGCFARASWLDADTPESAATTQSLVDGALLTLVFSDEFQVDGRTFNDGHDPRWTALNKNDYTNNALQFYDHDRVVTQDGYLNLSTIAGHTSFATVNETTQILEKHTKNFKSGMLQGWNKFCFTGGVMEIKARLPGPYNIGGFWPALWLMGNLARATYVGSSDWVWPWSYDGCNRDNQPKQSISGCNPHPHYAMEGNYGRGAPEIDIIEAQAGDAPMPPSNIRKPYVSTSLQVSPGIIGKSRPYKGGFPVDGAWYEGMEYGKNTSLNIYFYGSYTKKLTAEKSYQSDALSGNTQLNADLWSRFINYRLEWQMPSSDPDGQGYLRWYFDDELVYGVAGSVLGSKLGAKIPSEPMYMIMNTAMSSTWGFPIGDTGCPKGCDCECYDCLDTTGKCTCGFSPGFCESLPGGFLVDYVRVYQNEDDPWQKVGCSTPERSTKKWIEGHAKDYKMDEDTLPLLPQMVGGGACSPDGDECGSSVGRGKCNLATPATFLTNLFARSKADKRGVCVCSMGWVGPLCRAQDAGDDVVWEEEETLGPMPAPWLPFQLVGVAVALLAVFLTTYGAQIRKMRATESFERLASSIYSPHQVGHGGSMALSGSHDSSASMSRSDSYKGLTRVQSETLLSKFNS